MNHLKRISVIFFSLLTFVGSVGISEFAHFCKKDGAAYSYMIPPAHTCKPAKEQKSCCHSACSMEVVVMDDNCCQEEMKMFKITSEYSKDNTKIAFSFPIIIPFEKNYTSRTVFIDKNLSFHYDTRPPPKSGREISILNQTFII